MTTEGRRKPAMAIVGAVFLVPLVALLFAIFTSGCSHPATQAECESILRKTAELTLKEQTNDPAVIEERIAAYERAYGEKAISKCVGRAISKRALECVQKADSEEKVNGCLR